MGDKNETDGSKRDEEPRDKDGAGGDEGSDDKGDKKDGDSSSDDDKKDDDSSSGDDDKEDEKPKAVWPWLLAGAVVLVFVAIVLLIVLLPHEHVKTNDAYVAGHYTTLAPRVAGQVDHVYVSDNQPVRAGQLLVTLDPRDYQTALAQARATRTIDEARVLQADAQIARQPALIEQARAQIASARARLLLAQADQRRFANLASTGAGTFQQHQQADATLREAEAALDQAQAELISQQRQLDVLAADRAAAVAQLGRDDAQVAQARLNLGYTRIVAPIEATIAEKAVQVGNQVQSGSALMMLVPLHDLYVEANFRELELRHMRPGQHAAIHVDAYDIDLAGIVQSIAPASGATFSPIPPNNATGNFTKIVQRLPVKIVIAPHQPRANLLRAGMSVVATVDTNLDDVVGAQASQPGRVTAP